MPNHEATWWSELPQGWWRDVLGQLELVANDLHGFTTDARDGTIDLTEVPFDLPEFYDLLGFPAYHASRSSGELDSELRLRPWMC